MYTTSKHSHQVVLRVGYDFICVISPLSLRGQVADEAWLFGEISEEWQAALAPTLDKLPTSRIHRVICAPEDKVHLTCGGMRVERQPMPIAIDITSQHTYEPTSAPSPYVCSPELLRQITRWALTGETGTSSKYMAAVAAFGCGFAGEKSFIPCDMYDFVRCENMVTACLPFSAAFDELRKVSPVWREFVDRWDEMASKKTYKDYEKLRSEILNNHQ